MTPELWERVSAVLDELCELPDEQAASMIQRLEMTDPEVAAEVRSLLEQSAENSIPKVVRESLLERLLADQSPNEAASPSVTLHETEHRSLESSVDQQEVEQPTKRREETDALKVRCPDCHSYVAVIDDVPLSELSCQACGTNFSLIGDEALSHLTESGTQHRRRTFGQFELLELWGHGAFGAVWRARDTKLDRIVAIKIPRKGNLDKAETQQFLREARAAAQLQHSNIVAVHEVGFEDNLLYIVTEFIAGVSLAEFLEARQLTTKEAAQLCLKVADAIHFAHENGVIHRDLKPSNILLDANNEPHITDFGLAKRESGEITMTIDGAILGTPAYMSPEQARGQGHSADRRSDVYCLGVILYEMLTGELPYRGSRRMLLVQILQDEPQRPRNLAQHIPLDLETICLTCLEKKPAKRYQQASDLAAELRRFLNNEPILARPITPLGRVWRWCQKNPVISSLMLAVAASLLIGTSVSSYFALEASKRATSERKLRQEAQQATADLKKAISDAAAARRQARRTAQERLDQAAYYETHGKWREAEQVYGKILESNPNRVDALCRRAEILARYLMEFSAAEEMLARAAALGPVSNEHEGMRARLLSYLGDHAGHREICSERIRRFSQQGNALELAAIAPVCLSSQHEVDFVRPLIQAVKQAAVNQDTDPSRHLTLGIVNYRVGDLSNALLSLQRSNVDLREPRLVIVSHLFTAMNLKRSGDASSALESFLIAQELWDDWYKSVDSNDMTDQWSTSLFCIVAYREALDLMWDDWVAQFGSIQELDVQAGRKWISQLNESLHLMRHSRTLEVPRRALRKAAEISEHLSVLKPGPISDYQSARIHSLLAGCLASGANPEKVAAREHERRALELLQSAVDARLYLEQQLAENEDFDPIRSLKGFADIEKLTVLRKAALAEESAIAPYPPGQWVALMADQGNFNAWAITKTYDEHDICFSDGILTVSTPARGHLDRRLDSILIRPVPKSHRFVIHAQYRKSGFHTSIRCYFGPHEWSAYSLFMNDRHEFWSQNAQLSGPRFNYKEMAPAIGGEDWADVEIVSLDGELTYYINGQKFYSQQIDATSLTALSIATRRSITQWRDVSILVFDDEQAVAASEGIFPKRRTEIPVPRASNVNVPPGEWIDLLSMTQPLGIDTKDGSWFREGDTIRLNAENSRARLIFPVVVKGDYHFQCKLKRTTGNQTIAVMLPLESGHAVAVLDNQGRSAIAQLRGYDVSKFNPTFVDDFNLENGRTYSVNAHVKSDREQFSVRVEIDGATILEWSGPLSEVSEGYWTPVPDHRVCFGADHLGLVIEEARIKVNEGEATILWHVPEEKRNRR